MKLHRLLAGSLVVLTLPLQSLAQEAAPVNTNPACLSNLYDAFGREQRLARAVIFGEKNAEDAEIASVAYDREGNAWVKTGENSWRSAATGFENTTWSNALLDDEREQDVLCDDNPALGDSCVRLPRTGILETRKAPTSDLIHPIVQTIRALQCRLRAVCQVAAQSKDAEPNTRITVAPDGCLEMSYPVFEGCRTADQNIYTTLPGTCEAARQELVAREMELLTLTLQYDASYRSLLQFAGMFQDFLLQFRFPLIEPLWQMLRVLGGLQDIPCFQAECNE